MITQGAAVNVDALQAFDTCAQGLYDQVAKHHGSIR